MDDNITNYYDEKIKNVTETLKETRKKVKIECEKRDTFKPNSQEWKQADQKRKELEKEVRAIYNRKKYLIEQSMKEPKRFQQNMFNKMYAEILSKENDHEEFYIRNGIIYERFIKEYDKGHRPIQHIEKDYFEDLNLKGVSMRFFKWYLEKHCSFCDCEPCGCDKGNCECKNYDNKEFYDFDCIDVKFYDIVACSEKLKKEDIKALKLEYKNDTSEKNTSDEYFYAKIQYFKSPTRYETIRYEDYAIVYGSWAHMKPSGNNSKVKIKLDAKEDEDVNRILKKYFRRPDEMSKKTAESIINRLSKSNPNLKLAKPSEK